jgi:hypothetical protein
MSSFVCSDAHFNSIQRALTSSHKFSQYRSSYSPYYCLRDYNEKQIGSLVDTWHTINYEAVARQYGDNLFIPNRNHKDFKVITESGLVKALQCLNYQIEIHHIKNVRKLTTEEETAMDILGNLISEINENIVNKLPEYNTAEWELSMNKQGV